VSVRQHGEFEARLTEIATRTANDLASRLGAADTNVPDRLISALRHAVLGGGKRLRPFLVIEAARLFDIDETTAQPAASALECIHCYSLVHDDLPAMDNDELRRGQPTVWKAYDDWTAILAGDALLTLAFEILSNPDWAIATDRKLDLVRHLAVASGWAGMVGGQYIDLEADKLAHPAAPDEAHVRRLQAMKTGALILFGAEAGAILAGAPTDQRDALRGYGRALGLAFQIVDDLLDVEGDEAVVGKAVGKDADAGKATLISLLGVDNARAELAAAHRDALAHLDIFGDKADTLRAAADFVVSRTH
jgi:farnesyl diphosphate synthase